MLLVVWTSKMNKITETAERLWFILIICLPSQINELKVLVFSYLPSGTMTLTPGSNQWNKRGQETPLDRTAWARPLQSGYSVHGRLKKSKIAKINILTPPPSHALKQIFGEINNEEGCSGIPLDIFTSRNPDKNDFFLLPSVTSLAERI